MNSGKHHKLDNTEAKLWSRFHSEMLRDVTHGDPVGSERVFNIVRWFLEATQIDNAIRGALHERRIYDDSRT